MKIPVSVVRFRPEPPSHHRLVTEKGAVEEKAKEPLPDREGPGAVNSSKSATLRLRVCKTETLPSPTIALKARADPASAKEQAPH